ncbi:MAG: murein biosynthesis integral membrane protein MurJ [Phycisphaerae bacterium]|nr:murein biosynthesis integral membrane protein MurJ [Phycisphaerae bacterium]
MGRSFESNARLVTMLTFLSRIAGLGRDAVLSRVFGVGGMMDSFWFAFMIPNLFRRLFGEGALASAFLPVYTELHASDPGAARMLAGRVLAILVTLLGSIMLVGELILLLIHVSGISDPLGIKLLMIMLPYMPLVCIVAFLGSMLHVHRKFGPTASVPIILNLCIIIASMPALLSLVGFWSLDPRKGIMIVALGVTVAGVIQLAWSYMALGRGQFSLGSSDDDSVSDSIRRIIRQMLPMVLGLGVLQLNIFIDGLIASYPTWIGPEIFGIEYPLQQGAMSSLAYAQRLYEFPLGVFGIAIATAIFPELASAKGTPESFRSMLRRGLRLVMFIGLPASVGLFLVSRPLTAVIYQGGDFDAEDTMRVSRILLAYAPAIWSYSMVHLLTRAFYARGESMAPVKVAVSVVILNLVLNLILIWTPLKVAGLAVSTAICSIIQCGILLAMISGRLRSTIDVSVIWSWFRSLLLAAIMSVAVMLVGGLFSRMDTWWDACMLLVASVVTGGVVYSAGAGLLGMPELGWSTGMKRRSAV